MHYKRLSILVAAALLSGGCELIVRFDSSRLDAASDVQRPDVQRPDVRDDVVDASDAAADGEDVAALDGGDVLEMDVAMDAAMDIAMDAAMDAAMDVAMDAAMDVQPEIGLDAGNDAAEDAGGDAMEDTGSDAMEDAGSDAAEDAGGDGGSALAALNGCDPSTAVDLTAAGAMRTIQFPMGMSNMYDPPCIRVRAGQSVTFEAVGGSNFAEHPLRPGIVTGGSTLPQPGNPVVATDTGTSASFVFATPGSWGFYCSFHYPSGMYGAVYVVP